MLCFFCCSGCQQSGGSNVNSKRWNINQTTTAHGAFPHHCTSHWHTKGGGLREACAVTNCSRSLLIGLHTTLFSGPSTWDKHAALCQTQFFCKHPQPAGEANTRTHTHPPQPVAHTQAGKQQLLSEVGKCVWGSRLGEHAMCRHGETKHWLSIFSSASCSMRYKDTFPLIFKKASTAF